MKQNEKRFDAVKMMRQCRDRLSLEFKDLDFDYEKRYIRERVGARPATPGRETDGTSR